MPGDEAVGRLRSELGNEWLAGIRKEAREQGRDDILVALGDVSGVGLSWDVSKNEESARLFLERVKRSASMIRQVLDIEVFGVMLAEAELECGQELPGAFKALTEWHNECLAALPAPVPPTPETKGAR
jgi:hypothetical protein